jgi:hypothetical protein
MPSNKMLSNKNKINNNNLAYVGDEEKQTRKFIRNRNYAKKDNKLTKDNKSHKKEHREHMTKRFQKRIQETEESTKFRIPEPKKPKAKAVVKGQPKRKAQENWNDQWEDTELGKTVDLEEARKEVDRDEDNYFRAFEMPGEIEEFELQQYQSAKKELQEQKETILSYSRPLSVIEVKWVLKVYEDLQEKITSYENKQRLKELKAASTMTLMEYEDKKAELNKAWVTYKAHRIPRHLFDGARQYDENVLKLEICELQPVLDTKLSMSLRAKIREWENYFDQYYAQQEAEMREYFAEQELLQMIENSERFQNFVARLQTSQ